MQAELGEKEGEGQQTTRRGILKIYEEPTAWRGSLHQEFFATPDKQACYFTGFSRLGLKDTKGYNSTTMLPSGGF